MQEYIFMPTPTDIHPPERAHHLTLIFAISSWFIENESKFLINLTIIAYRVKLNFSLRTLYNTC